MGGGGGCVNRARAGLGPGGAGRWLAGCRRRGREASRPRPEGRGGRRAVLGWSRRGGMVPGPGRNGGDERYFFKYLYIGFPVVRPASYGGAPVWAGPGAAGMDSGGAAGGNEKPPPAISGSGGTTVLLCGHFRPRPESLAAAVPVDYASRAVRRPGRMSLTSNTLHKTLRVFLST